MSIFGMEWLRARCGSRMANGEWRMANRWKTRGRFLLLAIRYSLFATHYSLDSFDDRRGTHAGADAQRDERGGKVAPFEFVEHRAEDHGAGRAERMPHGDGAAVDVHLGVIEVERL